MRTCLNSILIVLFAAGLSAAQNAEPKSGLAKPVDRAATSLPSEATVDSFLQQTFGYQADLTWKISSIRPSAVPGLAEVSVVLASQQGQQLSKSYVSQDGTHALVGDIIPFGRKPFEAA